MGLWNSIRPWSNKLRLEDEPWPFETSRAKDALKALEEVAPPREDQQARAMESYDEAETSCFGCTCADSLWGPPAEERYEEYSNRPEFQWSSVQADDHNNTKLKDERIYKLQSIAERERPPASSSRY